MSLFFPCAELIFATLLRACIVLNGLLTASYKVILLRYSDTLQLTGLLIRMSCLLLPFVC